MLNKKYKNIYGYKFDYFNPNPKFIIEKNSIVLTVASLEQTGEEFEKYKIVQKAIEKEQILKEIEEDIKKLKKPKK